MRQSAKDVEGQYDGKVTILLLTSLEIPNSRYWDGRLRDVQTLSEAAKSQP